MNEATKTLLKRLAACIAGGLVLALMVGEQAGTEDDFGLAFHEALFHPRVVIFLLIGLAVFALLTFYPLIAPYIKRPGVPPALIGFLAVVISQFVMNWYDPLANTNNDGKFNAFGDAVADTSGLSPLTKPFYAWLAWTLVAVCIVSFGAAVVTRLRPFGYVTGVAGLIGAVLAYYTHADVVSVANGIDHSLGVYVDTVGFLVLGAAGVTAVRSHGDVADTRGFITKALEFRPGLVFSAIAIVWGIVAFATSGWFGQTVVNWTLSDASTHFDGSGIGSLASQYLSWLGWTLFAVCAVLSLVVTYLRHELLGWVNGGIAIVAVILTFVTIQSMTSTAATEAAQYGPEWKNLGIGGFAACMVFTLFAGAMLQAASMARTARRVESGAAQAKQKEKEAASPLGSPSLPITAMVERARQSSSMRAVLLIGVGVALFYPPTLPAIWQTTLVSQIGVYLLLALGLNVVVGWAGLLDLGYIAFYEIGAYTTAYFVGALPGAQPPSWLHWPAFAVVPVAVLACLIAGVLLGGPTLRLRGDYLAIVTLGFGEIIQILANNNPGGFTGGPVGPTIPHPRIEIPGIHITFGEDYLPYWYVLLIMLVIVTFLFYRLEGSRLGRAWAAIREDEVAAQASGVNTTQVKLLAFAIGASTSGFAGWFFSTQVGYFDPNLFTLQASILIVAYVVFGGMGSLAGSIAGAAALTWLPQFLKSQVPVSDRQMWVGAIVLAMMIFRPAGLLPAKRRKAELQGLDQDEQTESAAVPRAGAM